MYQLMLALLIAAALFQLFKPKMKVNTVFFWGLAGILTAMQAFRYDQGADYWGYRAIYAAAPYKRGFPLYWYTCDLHGEIGFKFLINLFSNVGIQAAVFYGIFGTVIMGGFIWATRKNSPYGNLSLLLFYPTFYLSYVLSGVRQAMAAVIFLAVAMEFLREEKYVRYLMIALLCATIHKLALFFLILLPIKWIRDKWILYCVPVAWCIGIMVIVTPIHEWLGALPELRRLGSPQVGIGGLAERTMMFAMISFLYWYGEKKDSRTTFLYKIYGIGYLIAVAGMVTAYGSQRITMPFKAVEIFLFPVLLAKCSTMFYKKLLWGGVVGISLIISLKNLNFYSLEYHAFNYPYIAIWEEKTQEQKNKEAGIVSFGKMYDEKYNAVYMEMQ